ncbi:MAG: hypothetical protein Q7S92_01185 [Candidatus Diapherotrites archaeon]|nr:hypothetical protein [Candidatus Diapherotrites archaeon]
MKNVTLTLSISRELKEEMTEIKGINWSQETRQFLEERIKRLRVLQKLDALTKNSSLTEKDVLELGRKINQGIARRHAFKK